MGFTGGLCGGGGFGFRFLGFGWFTSWVSLRTVLCDCLRLRFVWVCERALRLVVLDLVLNGGFWFGFVGS